MNSILWNCRGAGGKGFLALIRDLSDRYHANFLLLFETHISGRKAQVLIKKINFDDMLMIDGEGFFGRI